MAYSYDCLLKLKHEGKNLNWDEITKEQLEYLFIDESIPNQMIADLYDVTYEDVRRKRRKWDITIYSSKYVVKKFYDGFVGKNEEMFAFLNKNAKDRICKGDNFDWIAKALTHYLFRNGPVEDMHANHQLSQEDMKVLNKYMVNRIAGLLKLVSDGEWLKIELMLNSLKNAGIEWDEAEFDTSSIDMIFETERRELLKIQDM